LDNLIECDTFGKGREELQEGTVLVGYMNAFLGGLKHYIITQTSVYTLLWTQTKGSGDEVEVRHCPGNSYESSEESEEEDLHG